MSSSKVIQVEKAFKQTMNRVWEAIHCGRGADHLYDVLREIESDALQGKINGLLMVNDPQKCSYRPNRHHPLLIPLAGSAHESVLVILTKCLKYLTHPHTSASKKSSKKGAITLINRHRYSDYDRFRKEYLAPSRRTFGKGLFHSCGLEETLQSEDRFTQEMILEAYALQHQFDEFKGKNTDIIGGTMNVISTRDVDYSSVYGKLLKSSSSAADRIQHETIKSSIQVNMEWTSDQKLWKWKGDLVSALSSMFLSNSDFVCRKFEIKDLRISRQCPFDELFVARVMTSSDNTYRFLARSR